MGSDTHCDLTAGINNAALLGLPLILTTATLSSSLGQLYLVIWPMLPGDIEVCICRSWVLLILEQVS